MASIRLRCSSTATSVQPGSQVRSSTEYQGMPVEELILAAIVDAVFLRFRLRKLLTAKFGSTPRGSVFYGLTRSLQIRRWRMPRPKVARREYPS